MSKGSAFNVIGSARNDAYEEAWTHDTGPNGNLRLDGSLESAVEMQDV